jgi:hypothetical protein
MAPWPSGKAGDCKSPIRQFDSDRCLWGMSWPEPELREPADAKAAGAHIGVQNRVVVAQNPPLDRYHARAKGPRGRIVRGSCPSLYSRRAMVKPMD